MTRADGTAGPPARCAPDAAAAAGDAEDVEARVLVDELAGVVGGARHEARFIVEEVLDVGPGGLRPSVVPAGAAAAARAMAALSRLFLDLRASLADIEINPLMVLAEGQGVRAVDLRTIAR